MSGCKRYISFVIFAALQNSAWAQDAAEAQGSKSEAAADLPRAPLTPKKVFLNLLKEYKRYPKDFFAKAQMENPDIDAKKIDAIDYSMLDRLSPAVLQARYTEYNVTYLTYKRIESKLFNERKLLEKRRKNTPLTNYAEIKDIELKIAAQSSHYEQSRYLVFSTSINANMSVMDAIATLSPEQKKAAATAVLAKQGKAVEERPKLPGVYQGSESDRRKLRESDKINLTPVDAEFYTTQLGKKLESDLGGKADFWSYDYATDELYVKVGKDVAKVNVFQDPGGVRFIRTRSGAAYTDAKTDEKIDMLGAKGRFLTGDKHEETLFGKMPPSNDNIRVDTGGHPPPASSTKTHK